MADGNESPIDWVLECLAGHFITQTAARTLSGHSSPNDFMQHGLEPHRDFRILEQ